MGIAQRRFAAFGGQEVLHLWEFHGQAFLGNHAGDALLVVDGEGFAPVSLTREDGIAQAVVHLHTAKAVLADELLCGGNGFLDGKAVQRETVQRRLALHGRVHHDTLLGIVTLLAHVGTLHQWDDGQVEMTCKGIVARVVCRYCHDGTGTITGEDILGNVYGALLASDGVDAV